MAGKIAGQGLSMVPAATFILAGAVFISITADVMFGEYLARTGRELFQTLQGIRTPLLDTILIAVTMLGDAAVTLPVTLVAVAWLLFAKHDRYSGLFLAATAGIAFLLVTVIKQITQIPRPLDIYGGAVHYAFPSSHATMSLVIYGFLAFLCSRELQGKKRCLPFGFALGLILAIGGSRLYLGAHWLADVVGGFSLGTAWLMLMFSAFQYGKSPCRSQGLFRFLLIVWVLIATVHWTTGFAGNRLRYPLPPVVQSDSLP